MKNERSAGLLLTGTGLASLLVGAQMTSGQPWVPIIAGTVVLVIGLLMAVFGG